MVVTDVNTTMENSNLDISSGYVTAFNQQTLNILLHLMATVFGPEVT
jgi:hypothetical protein